MRVVLIGSVRSSERALKIFIDKKLEICMVFSLDEAYSQNVSGYVPIHKIASENNIPYKTFKNINDEENVKIIEEVKPDYIFVIGLSQLVKDEILNSAKIGVIGYHPAPLPKYRGRAALVWQMLLREKKSAVTLFFINKGIDSGDIICQEEFEIKDDDYIEDVMMRSAEAGNKVVAKGIDLLLDPDFKPTPQNEDEATYLLKRTPADGKIDWSHDGRDILKLIRATSRPFPGAFANYENKADVIFWKADYYIEEKYIGFNGQIISKDEGTFDVLCNGGFLRVYDYSCPDDVKLVVGHKFI